MAALAVLGRRRRLATTNDRLWPRWARSGFAAAGAAICGLVLLWPASLTAQSARPRSILIVDDASTKAPFYYAVFARVSAIVNSGAGPRVNLYTESLDLARFRGAEYERSQQQAFEVKYRDRPIGLIVAIGSGALDQVLRWRPALWPSVPVAFAMVDEPTAARLSPPPDVTGYVMKLRFADMMSVARAVVPDLGAVALVGDRLENQNVYRHSKEEILAATKGVDVIDLTGLKMRELRQRVATLPDRTAILYSGIFSDGEGTSFIPAVALSLVAETANRPIVVAAETNIGRGGIGGFVITPALVGDSIARLAMRILDGESAASIPVSAANIARPIFDWRQLKRWNVSEAALPAGSEIRFREPSLWEQHRSEVVAAGTLILLQAALIGGLLHEHRRRRSAEIETRQRMAELAHMNRYATAGEMSASIAHELTQPLAAILLNAEAAEMMINSASPDLHTINEALAAVKRDDQHAGEVLRRLRGLLKKGAFEPQVIDLDETISEVFDFMQLLASARGVSLSYVPPVKPLYVRGDRVQLQQVILNLIVNGMDALAAKPAGQRQITGRTRQSEDSAEVSISDSGPGIPADRLDKVFEPFFTTKNQGMGMGLSIVRTIVKAHGGRIWAENQIDGGAVFRLSLPLVGAEHTQNEESERSESDLSGRAAADAGTPKGGLE
jgi:signal transduction histidine kinase